MMILPHTIHRLSFIVILMVYTLFGQELSAQKSRLQFKELIILDENLPFITEIYQDSRGFIWLGTYNGLYRYDGIQLIHYFHSPGDSLSLGDNRIQDILEDENGNLWLGAQLGLHFLDTKKMTFKVVDDSQFNLKNQQVHQIAIDQNGILWVAAQFGLFKIDPESHKIIRIETIPVQEGKLIPSAITINENRISWVSNFRDLYVKMPTEQDFRKTKFTDQVGYGTKIFNLNEGAQNTIWVSTNQGLYQFDAIIDSIFFSNKWPNAKELYYANTISINDHERLVISTEELFSFNNSFDFDPLSLANFTPQPEKLSATAFLKNEQQQLWLACSPGRIFIADLAANPFQFLPLSIFQSIGSTYYLFEMYEYQEGQLLIPTLVGAKLINYQTGDLMDFPFKPDYNVEAWESGPITFYEDQNKVWISCWDGGLFLFDKTLEEFINLENISVDFSILRDQMIRDIHKDHLGNVWLAPGIITPLK